MKPERILEIAHKHCDDEGPIPIWYRDMVLAAISDAVAETIERCAKVCDVKADTLGFGYISIAGDLADAIRALTLEEKEG